MRAPRRSIVELREPRQVMEVCVQGLNRHPSRLEQIDGVTVCSPQQGVADVQKL